MAVDAANSTMHPEVRKMTPRKILAATTALNGCYAILQDEFNEGATNFATVYQKFDQFTLSKRLAEHWRGRSPQLGPGDEYNLVDEFADIAIYLFELADNLGIDLLAAINAKLAKNEAKYPVHKAKGSAKKYTQLR